MGIQGDNWGWCWDNGEGSQKHQEKQQQKHCQFWMEMWIGMNNSWPVNISQESQHRRQVPLASLANEMSEAIFSRFLGLGFSFRFWFQAIFSRTGERYQPGTAREVFGLWGLAGGATDDWYITQVTILCLRRRSNGSFGTFLPRESMISVLLP